MRSVPVSATLFLLLSPSSIAGAADSKDHRLAEHFEPSALAVAIAVRAASVEGAGRILVDVVIENPTSADERLERWLALEPPKVTTALLRISRADGSPVRYIGRH